MIRALSGYVVIAALCSGACAIKGVERDVEVASRLRPPQPVMRPVQGELVEFGKMLRAHLPAIRNGIGKDIVIEIELITNADLQRSLPTDLGGFARQVINDIGLPLRSTRTLPPIALLPSGPIGLPYQPPAQTPKAASDLRLTGSLLYASDVVDRRKKGRIDFMSKHPEGDSLWSFENGRSVTQLVLQLSLEEPNGLAVPGATVMYQIEVEHRERERSFSFYIAGNGMGGSTRTVVAQNLAAGLYDATAVAMMRLLGHAWIVPYDTLPGSTSIDAQLTARKRASLQRATQQELEQMLKVLLYGQGYTMSLSTVSFSAADQAIVAQLEQSLKVPHTRDGLVEVTLYMWRNLDYGRAAERIDAKLIESIQRQRENAAAPLPAAAAESHRWQNNDPIVTIDLAGISELATRRQIRELASRCAGCTVWNDTAISRIEFQPAASAAVVIERLQRSAMAIDLAWADQTRRTLLVTPRRRSAPVRRSPPRP